MFSLLKDYKESLPVFLFNLIDRLTFVFLYVVLARIVDFEKYGLIVSIFAFVNLLLSIFDFGLPFYIQRESANHHDIKPTIQTALHLKILSSFIMIISLLLYSKNFDFEYILIFMIFLVNFFYALNQILIFALNGKGLFNVNLKSALITRLPLFIFWIVVLAIFRNFQLLFFSLLLIVLIQFLYLAKQLKIYLIDIFDAISSNNIYTLLKKSIPFGFTVLFVMTYDKIDVLLLQMFRSNTEVAIYSSAYALYRNSPLISGAFLIPLYTRYTINYKATKNLNISTFLKDFLIIFSLSVSLVLILKFFGELLILIFYGKKFLISTGVLLSLSFALPFLMLNNFTGVVLNSIQKEKIVMWSTFLGMVLNVSLNFILIKLYGMSGAILTTFYTEFFVFIFQFLSIIFIAKFLKSREI